MAKGKGEVPPVPETPTMFKESGSYPLTEPQITYPLPAEKELMMTPAVNSTPARKKPERTPLSGDLQAAAKIDRLLAKLSPQAAIATLEYLLGIYEAKVPSTSN